MNDRNMKQDRERRWRAQENDDDWDWYYYEYRYVPYSSRENLGERDRFGRNQDQNYGRDYGTDYERDYETYGSSTWNRGRYSGVGPRGYRRSDDRIKEDVNDYLTWHGEIDATDIQVEVNDGLVTLKGEVNSRYEKRMAENISENVSGVWDVNNNLRINRQTGWNRTLGDGTELRDQIRERMKVVGQDGEEVGEVKEIRSNDFLVDRTMARDVYVPFHAAQFMDDHIRLNVRADEVDDQDWPMPELFETGEETSPRMRR